MMEQEAHSAISNIGGGSCLADAEPCICPVTLKGAVCVVHCASVTVHICMVSCSTFAFSLELELRTSGPGGPGSSEPACISLRPDPRLPSATLH